MQGGGLAVNYCQNKKASVAELAPETELELLAARLSSRSASLTAVCIYRPPDPVTELFNGVPADPLD
jgi:hypothetical protein